jgi:acetoin utilization deacetylase AcuC-like enzyme
VLVVDCDVHQGDGTARMLADYAHAYTFSIHSARNYPHQKSVSDLDIGLPDGTGDAAYLEQLSRGLEHAFRQARPDVVFAIAGADVYAGDRLGRLALTKAGIAQRDELVFSKAAGHAAALVVVMGGGYAVDISDIVDIHCRSVLLALAGWQERQSAPASKPEPSST